MRSLPAPELPFSAHLNHTCTSESLDAISRGLRVSIEDKVAAIGGSGDQAFALLEHASAVTVVDTSASQLEFIWRRAERLTVGDFKGFLEVREYGQDDGAYHGITNMGFLAYCLERRNAYFDKPGRLEAIRDALRKRPFTLQEGDIFVEARSGQYNKLYLSNAYPHGHWETFMDSLGRNLPLKGLIYLASPYHEETIPPELRINWNRTNIARGFQRSRWNIWNPIVYQRVG